MIVKFEISETVLDHLVKILLKMAQFTVCFFWQIVNNTFLLGSVWVKAADRNARLSACGLKFYGFTWICGNVVLVLMIFLKLLIVSDYLCN